MPELARVLAVTVAAGTTVSASRIAVSVQIGLVQLEIAEPCSRGRVCNVVAAGSPSLVTELDAALQGSDEAMASAGRQQRSQNLKQMCRLTTGGPMLVVFHIHQGKDSGIFCSLHRLARSQVRGEKGETLTLGVNRHLCLAIPLMISHCCRACLA